MSKSEDLIAFRWGVLSLSFTAPERTEVEEKEKRKSQKTRVARDLLYSLSQANRMTRPDNNNGKDKRSHLRDYLLALKVCITHSHSPRTQCASTAPDQPVESAAY